MEALTTTSINYSFIAVPTQLFILLDYRLKLVLTSLIQVSTALANSQGWFFYSLEDLKKLCGLKNDKTVRACVETLYRLGIVKVQSKTFTNNIGSRTANYYSLNFIEIEKYNEYSIYECLNIPELHINMLDYTAEDYITTYTATTSTPKNEENAGNAPLSPQNSEGGQLPSQEGKNAPTALEMASTVNEEDIEVSDEEIDRYTNDPDVECPLTPEELREALRHSKFVEKQHSEDNETELEQAEAPTEQIKVDGELVETASVIPTDISKIERRSYTTNDITQRLDESVRQKCADLVERYKTMVIPNPNESCDKCNAAVNYITQQYKQGFIDIEDKDRMCRELINARFAKHSI